MLTFSAADFMTVSGSDALRAEKTVTVSITDDSAYDGATAETFTLTLAHGSGERIEFVDGGAEATVSIIDDDEAPAVPDAPTSLTATEGNAEVVLRWTAGSDGGSAITAHQYRKKVGSGNYEATWTPIPNSEAGGANANSYTVTTGLTNGTAYTFQVRAVNTVGEGAEATSAEVTPSTANTPATGAPEITGTAQVGVKLTAAQGTMADVEGLPTFPADFTFQWVRVDADGTSNPDDITGATSDTYTPVAADEGKKIKVRVSFEDNAGNPETLTSPAYPASGTVVPPNTPATGAPEITGTAQVGETLTAALGLIADDDNLPATFPDDYTFQWQRLESDGTNPMDIQGATSSTYTLGADDAGKKVKVNVTFTDGGSTAETRPSDAYPSSGTVRAAPPPRADGADGDGGRRPGVPDVDGGLGRRQPDHDAPVPEEGRQRQLRRLLDEHPEQRGERNQCDFVYGDRPDQRHGLHLRGAGGEHGGRGRQGHQ